MDRMQDADVDSPGYAHLPAVSPLLYVGNGRAAARDKAFAAVISAVVPRDNSGKCAPGLMTHAALFEDFDGCERSQDLVAAMRSIVDGASAVAEALETGKRTLVSCEYGQNQSCAICCAYAVLHLGWAPDDAIGYIRERNFADRSMGAMFNKVFNDIISKLGKQCTAISHSRSDISSSTNNSLTSQPAKPHTIPSVTAIDSMSSFRPARLS